MIQTMMALWNRGTSGRLLVMVVTFFSLCISISLLFVTVGSIWGSLLTHARLDGSPQRPVSNAVLITATAPPPVTPTIVQPEVTPTLPPNPCLATPTGAHGDAARVDATDSNARKGIPARTATSRPRRRTPTPSATLPTPSPTSGAAVTPTITPITTNTPASTPTVTATPTATSTPGASPTPTVTVTSTATSTPGATPTTTVTGTSVNTPTAMPVATTTVTVPEPAGSPTVVVSETGGVDGRQGHDGRPQTPPGTPGDTTNGQPGQVNCLGDALTTSGETSLLSRLQDFIWVILLSSLLGTALFCGQMYGLSSRARR